MAVGRYQVPLAPAFAITAHASQGQTLNAALVDLQHGNGVSVIASYVAITRVRCRADLIIYRPFDREVFSGGPLLGPSTLLKQLRGETIDWEEIQERLQPRQRCSGCHMRKGTPQYDLAEWRAEEEGWCRACVQEKVAAGTPLRCSRCHHWRKGVEYNAWNLKHGRRRFCKECLGVETRECVECKREGKHQFFGATWDEENDVRLCLACRSRPCCSCSQSKGKQAFGDQWDAAADVRQCRECQRVSTCSVCTSPIPMAELSGAQQKQITSKRKCRKCAEDDDNNKRRRVEGEYVCNMKGGCARKLGGAAFDATQLRNWVSNSKRGRLWCLECTAAGDSYQCTMPGGCGKNLGRASFAPKQIENFKQRNGRLWCKVCTQKAAKRTTSKVKR